MLKTGYSIAARAAAVGIFKRGLEHVGLGEVFTGGTTAATLGLQEAPMHGAIGHPSKLINHAVIAQGHATRTVAQLKTANS